MTTEPPWPRPDCMDALLGRADLTPRSGQQPGARKPEHTHRAPSVMIIDEPARVRYHQGCTPLFESQAPSGP